MISALIAFLIVWILVGLLVWAVTQIIPMPAQYAKAIQVIVLVIMIFWSVSYWGYLPEGFHPRH